MRPMLLIAEREFRAYVGGATFWVALLLAPLLALGAALFVPSTPAAPPIRTVALSAADAALRRVAVQALADAAALEGAGLRLVAPGTPGVTTVVVRSVGVGPEVEIDGPLEATARATLARDLAQAAREAKLRAAGLRPELLAEVRAVDARLHEGPRPPQAPDPRVVGVGRFALMAVLWGALVGSLGMLLQAVVRERVNRSLETLLANARPSALVAGKLLGVGAVSVLVLASWLGAAALLGRVPGLSGLSRHVAEGFGATELARAALIYPFAFAMYGAAMVAVGVVARDLAAAQNLSRPVFGALLLVFFTAFAAAGGAAGGDVARLVWAPPLTPFILLLFPGALSPSAQLAAFALMALTAAGLGSWAARRLARSV